MGEALTVLGSGARLAGLPPGDAASTVIAGARAPCLTTREHERWPECGPFLHAQPSVAEAAATVDDPGRPLPPLQVLLAMDACDQALEGAAGHLAGCPADRVAVVLTSDFGPTSLSGELQGELVTRPGRPVSPLHFARSVHNYAAGALARRGHWLGPALTVTGPGLGTSAAILASGAADLVVQVAVDEIGGIVPALAAGGLLETDGTRRPLAVAPSCGSAALVLARHDPDGDGEAVRLDVRRGPRVTPTTPFACDPRALEELLDQLDGSPGRLGHGADGAPLGAGEPEDVFLLSAGSERGVEAELAAVRRVAGAHAVAFAPWTCLGEPFAVKATGSVALACALALPVTGRGVARVHCLVSDLAGGTGIVTATPRRARATVVVAAEGRADGTSGGQVPRQRARR